MVRNISWPHMLHRDVKYISSLPVYKSSTVLSQSILFRLDVSPRRQTVIKTSNIFSQPNLEVIFRLFAINYSKEHGNKRGFTKINYSSLWSKLTNFWNITFSLPAAKQTSGESVYRCLTRLCPPIGPVTWIREFDETYTIANDQRIWREGYWRWQS